MLGKEIYIFEHFTLCYYGYDYHSIPHLLFCDTVIITPILQKEKLRLSQHEQPFTLTNKRYSWDLNVARQAGKLVLFRLPHF